MTEQEWLACTDPRPMLRFMRSRAGDRKLRPFAVACCRRISYFVVDSELHPQNRQDSQNALKVTDLFADGLATSIRLAVRR